MAAVDADRPINDGMRIFPGLVDPNEQEHANTRRKVNLVAQVAPRIPGVTVRFRIWDVDDPFDQLYGPNHRNGVEEIPNVTVIDSSPLGNDNRGVAPGFSNPYLRTGTTDVDGRATIDFSVSMQPGDNFRAAATCLPYVLSSTPTGTPAQVDASDANALGVVQQADQKYYPNGDCDGYQVPVVWSKMLTVWRKLHVEVDSMGAVDWTAAAAQTGNAQAGTVQAAPTFNAQNNHAFIDIADLHGDFHEDDQHLVGRIDITGFGSFTTVATETSFGDDVVEIINAPPTIVNADEAPYTLWDDDAGSVTPFIMVAFDAPPVTLPQLLDTSLMAGVFEKAYVHVEPPDMQYYDANTPFARNIANNGEAETTGNSNKDLSSSADFWVVHVTAGYQGYIDKDGDPDIEQGGEGLQYGITAVTGLFNGERAGSIVHLETIRDDKRGNLTAMAELERYTVTHEAGHQFLLEHEDGRFPDPTDQNPGGDYIMTDKTDQTGMAPNVAFSATSLNKIRSVSFPPQGG